MKKLNEEIIRFRYQREEAAALSSANAALLTIAGLELEDARKAEPARNYHLRVKLKRLLERERLKGLNRHAAYDLKKHIGLKAAFDILCRQGNAH